jgi:hypothetical protein
MRETLRLVSEHHLDEGNRLDDMLLEIGRVGHVALRKLLLREGHSLEKAKEYGASPKYMSQAAPKDPDLEEHVDYLLREAFVDTLYGSLGRKMLAEQVYSAIKRRNRVLAIAVRRQHIDAISTGLKLASEKRIKVELNGGGAPLFFMERNDYKSAITSPSVFHRVAEDWARGALRVFERVQDEAYGKRFLDRFSQHMEEVESGAATVEQSPRTIDATAVRFEAKLPEGVDRAAFWAGLARVVRDYMVERQVQPTDQGERVEVLIGGVFGGESAASEGGDRDGLHK